MDALNGMNIPISEPKTAVMGVEQAGPPQEFEFVSVKGEPQWEEGLPYKEFEFVAVKEEMQDDKEHLDEVSEDIIVELETCKNEGDIQEASQGNIGIEDCIPSIWVNYRSTDIPSMQAGDLYRTERQQLEYVSGSVIAESTKNQEFNDKVLRCEMAFKQRKQFIFTCETCLARFPTKHSLIVHVFKHIENVQPPSIICCWCGEVFQSAEHRRHHMLSVRSRLDRYAEKSCQHTCKICRKSFQSAFYLREHHRSHTGERPYTCDVCEKKFSRKTHLKGHLQIHVRELTAGKLPYSCDICGNCFTHLGHLEKHMQNHADYRPFVCDICGNGFKYNRNLSNHKIIHTGEKPYSCELCGKFFLRLSYMQAHKRIHTDERPYRCDTCGKCFRHTGALITHKRIHTGEKPYFCNICRKTYTRRRTLNNHKCGPN